MNNRQHKSLSGDLKDAGEAIPIDYFIMAANTDKRCYSAYDLLKEKHTQFGNIIVLDYVAQRPEKDTLLEEYYYKLRGLEKTVYVECENENDDCIYLSKAGITNESVVWIDITCLNIPSIFRVLYVFKEVLEMESLDVIYSEPKYYDFFNGFSFKYDKKSVSREYRALEEFFVSAGTRDVILVCFLGFERLISKYVHERNDHAEIIAVNGFPSFLPKIKDISLEHNYELISAIGPEQVRYAQANDPFSAYNVLVDIMQSKNDALLDICVLGSKPMALGAGLFALDHQENVKVSYPFPREFQKHTSTDVSNSWWYTITF